LASGRRLADRQLREQFGGDEIEIDLAVGGLRVEPDRCNRDRGAIQQDAGKVRAEATDRDVRPFARDFAADGDAGDAVYRFRDVRVGELADVLGEDRIREADRIAFGVRLAF
jgi:hypothetical protein